MNPLLAATIAAFVAGFGIGGAGAWKVQALRADSAELERTEKATQDARRAASQADRAAEAFETRQAAASARESTVQKEVIRVVTKVEYRADCLDADGMRILTADIDAANAGRRAAPAVPTASAAR